MSKLSAFRLTTEAQADLDIITTQLGINKTDVVCRALAFYRANVTGLVPASSLEAPPPADDTEAVPAAEHGPVPGPDVPPPASQARPFGPVNKAIMPSPAVPAGGPASQARPFGPVKVLRPVPIVVPDLPSVHRLLNPVTKARLS